MTNNPKICGHFNEQQSAHHNAGEAGNHQKANLFLSNNGVGPTAKAVGLLRKSLQHSSVFMFNILNSVDILY